MDSIIDIFNNLLKINENNIMIIFDKESNIWFKMRDIMNLLEYKDVRSSMAKFNINDDNRKTYEDIKTKTNKNILPNSQKNTIFINEGGLYQLLTKSQVKKSKIIRDEIFGKIIPQIRKTGSYSVNEKTKEKLDTLNKKLENLENENNYLYGKQEYVLSNFGYIYCKEVKTTVRGVTTICYKIGFAIDMNDRTGTYKTGNTTTKILFYIPLKVDYKQLENCVNNSIVMHRLKKNNEIFCDLSLRQIKHEISKCIGSFSDHICHCNKCKKKFNVNKLNEHQCNKKLTDIKFLKPKRTSKNKSNSRSKNQSKSRSKRTSRNKSKRTSRSKSKRISRSKSKRTSRSKSNSKSKRISRRKSNSKSKRISRKNYEK